jgi:7-cyano-7-deazaguanine reductase
MEDKFLGKEQGDYSKFKGIQRPTPEVLVPVARSIERNKIFEYDADPIPMIGFDTWHGYEVSVLTDRGMPMNYIAKIVYNADTPNIIESKSMKLYWNSFNMFRMCDIAYVKRNLKDIAEIDLSAAAGGKVSVELFEPDQYMGHYLNTIMESDILYDFPTLGYEGFSLEQLEITDYKDNVDILIHGFPYNNEIVQVKTDKLRSNCKVTHQPDFGDLYIYFEPNHFVSPNWASVLKYIISFRQESHFHEEIVERIYHSLYTVYEPRALMVGARYTRRGGWDINPFRASNYSLFSGLTEADVNSPDLKLGRQ